ncbi:MAG: hypothetical protein IJU43_05165 [Lachnospiraceae bacterium]|nr:hypothetical protein [Lachnospiraceae bacterium]
MELSVKRIDKRILVLCAVDILIAFLAKLVHPVFSIWEILLIFYGFGCMLFFGYQLFFKNIKINILALLKLSFLLIMGVTLYSTMTYGQANVHGDTAIATLLGRAELSHHSLFPRSWCYANGDIWILDTQLAVLPFSLIMKDQVAARMLGTLLMVLIGIVSMIALDKTVLKADEYIISLPVICAFLFGGNTDLMWGNDHIDYQASYTCWLFLIPIMCILVYRTFICTPDEKKKRYILYAIYTVFSIVCFARGIRAIAELMLPLTAACLLYVLLRDGLDALHKWYKGILYLVPMMIGCAMYKILCATHIVNTSVTSGTAFVESLETAFDNAKIVFINMFKVFGYNEGSNLASVRGLANMVSIVSCILFCFVIPILQIKKYEEEPEGVKYFFLFAVIHNIEMIISTIFLDKTSPSHILTFVLVSIMMSAVYVMRHWITGNRQAFIYGGLFIFASVVMMLQLGLASRGWIGKVADRRAVAQELVDHGLNECKGYGTFWNIYPLSIYSDLALDVAAIGDSDIAFALKPHLNLVDKEKYIPSDGGSYILLDYNENKEAGASLEDIFGECADKFEISENYIYVWDYDVCVNDFGGRTR